MRTPLKLTLTTLLLTATLLAQQETGLWHATSSNAKAITGDIALSAQKLTINFLAFTMVRVRNLDAAETSAAFGPDSSGPGGLYRLEIPGAQKFLRKNSLCGGDDIHWMVTFVSGHSLQLAFFSAQKPPVFTIDALANSSDLCGTYTYSR